MPLKKFLNLRKSLQKNKNPLETEYRAKPNRVSELRVADLTMDLVAHKVFRVGKPIDLTSKEYALLEYLMRNEKQILTRTMISESVWDYHFDSLTNVIGVHMYAGAKSPASINWLVRLD